MMLKGFIRMPVEDGNTADKPQRGKRPKQGEPVIDRALSLLAVFSDRRRALTLSDMARLADMPAPTALRLIARLVAWGGALERLEDGRYVVGVRLWEVASLSPRGHGGVRDIALPYLEDLFAVTRHHVLLAVRDKNEAVLIERLSSKEATEVAYRVGGRAPLRSTAVGLVLLSGADADFQELVISQPPDIEVGVVPCPRSTTANTLRCPQDWRGHDPAIVAVADCIRRFAHIWRRGAGGGGTVDRGSRRRDAPNVLAPAVQATARAVSRTGLQRRSKRKCADALATAGCPVGSSIRTRRHVTGVSPAPSTRSRLNPENTISTASRRSQRPGSRVYLRATACETAIVQRVAEGGPPLPLRRLQRR